MPAAPQVRILKEVNEGVGADALNTLARGAVAGALACMEQREVLSSAMGNGAPLAALQEPEALVEALIAAATAGLQRALGTLAESSSAGSLERIVRDSDGIMAAAAAERAAWEATALPEPEAWQLPDDMHATLREHTRVQVEEFLERTF